MIGGVLDVSQGKPHGTVVTCRFPIEGEEQNRI